MSRTSRKKTVVAVLMPREHLPFIREWCLHHLRQGWSLFLYDNTGSQGSTRKTSPFSMGCFQQESTDKRGNRYGNHTRTMTDPEVQEAFRREVAGLDVEIVPWQPRDESGRIVHGQVEAYVDFIRHRSTGVDWAAFIDADEYLVAGNGLDWDMLLSEVERRGCHRVMLEGHGYETRWTPEGEPRSLESLVCSGLQSGGQKNLVKPSTVVLADIHWGWRTRGSNAYITVDSLQYHFRHYNGFGRGCHLALHVPEGTAHECESLPVDPDGTPSAGAVPEAPVPSELPAFEKFSTWQVSEPLERYLRTELFGLLPGPSSILELGPGLSTLLFSKLYPESRITSIEHNEPWLEKARHYLAATDNVDLRLAPLGGDPLWYDLDPAELGPCDLLFIDGPPSPAGPRIREGALALKPNLQPGAIVILNNTDRMDERTALSKWCALGLEIILQRYTFTILRHPRSESG